MAKAPEFDVSAARSYFSARCFNRAWDLIEKTGRTPEPMSTRFIAFAIIEQRTRESQA